MPLALIAGSSILSAGASIYSASKGAQAITKASNSSIAEQRRQYNQTRTDQAPWRDTGVKAVDRLASLYGVARDGVKGATNPDGSPAAYGGFETTPGYQFRRDEGLKAINRGASARGALASGAEFNTFADRLASLAGVGQTATQATSAAGSNAANNISAAYTNAGNATASAYGTAGAAINNGLNNISQAYLFNRSGGFKIPEFKGSI
jgi:hypothetical protein